MEQASEEDAKTHAVGIDLGTTYSCVGALGTEMWIFYMSIGQNLWKINQAFEHVPPNELSAKVYKDGEVQIIANDQGNRTTPSYVAWTEQERLLGDAAKNQVASNPTNTVFDAKRLIGRRFDDPVVQADLKLWPFRVVSDGTKDDKPLIEVLYQGVLKKFHPEEISSMILTKMKTTAEAYLGHRVKDAVITVPAYFNDAQRQATKDAGEIAGLRVLRIVNEPTAAAIAYGLDKDSTEAKKSEKETNILVFDMGGGTFDVSVLAIQDSVFEVKATAGDPHLGGEDFDNRILSHCIADFRRKFGVDPTRNQRALRRLRTQCERAKRQLSTQTSVTIEVDSLHDGNDFSLRLSRAKFEELCMDYFKKAMEPVEQCLKDSNLPQKAISDIVMVGGSTRIPKVQELIKGHFGGKELCKSINPDEAVAYGAAVQAAIVSGQGHEDVQNMLLLDVAPLSLGIETAGGMMQVLIERNSTVPTSKSQDFTTFEDYQDHVDISVYEGERAMVKDNNFLGKFTLKDIPKSLRGVPKIQVTFTIDTNGILQVSAEDAKSQKKSEIQIANEKGRLTQNDIQRMLQEAEQHKGEDEISRGDLLAKEELKVYMQRFEKGFQDLDQSKLQPKDRERLEGKLMDAQKWLETEGLKAGKPEFEAKQKELQAAINTVMLRINRAQAEFWDQQVVQHEGEKSIADGGFILQCGVDIRELIEEPQ
ncbi:HSPA1A [Symbiodinium natans]|uniref:HSPA1A protein n=1 Tax=Symbiodinium natans TaxID=878477 RepID=A0A812UMS0_9DINO|nr:HSPA1A [Symbiodinium natans]